MSGWRVEGLCVERPAFRLGPIDLTVGDGEAVAVLGPNGSGKSTLLRALAGLEGISAGSVLRGEEDRTDYPPERRGLGYVPPGGALFPHRTVRRNLSYPAELRGDPDAGAQADGLLERFGLAGLAGRYPRTLSSGEQQRVAIARALAVRPSLLLFDEPVAAMDLPARRAIHEALRSVRDRERVPILFVTHDPADAFGIADRFLRLEGGRTRRTGRMGEFAGRPSDTFDARFLGYPNVLSRELLEATEGPLARWLVARSGPGGLAFSARALAIDPGGPFEAVVRRVEPLADASVLRLTTAVGELLAEGERGRTGETLPAPGTSVRFALSEGALWPLDTGGSGGIT